jgi:hypothetical protein
MLLWFSCKLTIEVIMRLKKLHILDLNLIFIIHLTPLNVVVLTLYN